VQCSSWPTATDETDCNSSERKLHCRAFAAAPETLRGSLRGIHLAIATSYLRSGCFARDAINYGAPFGAANLEALSSVGSATRSRARARARAPAWDGNYKIRSEPT